jgi:hypothetical protein
MVNGKQFEIIVPLYSGLMARGCRFQSKSAAVWNWRRCRSEGARLSSSRSVKITFPPSNAAHTTTSRRCFMQMRSHAQAHSAYPVVEALEDFRFDGMGNVARQLYRGSDQCWDVLVMEGVASTSGNANAVRLRHSEIVEETPRSIGMPKITHVRRRRWATVTRRISAGFRGRRTPPAHPPGATAAPFSIFRTKRPRLEGGPMDAIVLQILM